MNTEKRRLVAFNAHLLTAADSYRSAGIAVYVMNLLRHLADVPDGLEYRVLLGTKDWR